MIKEAANSQNRRMTSATPKHIHKEASPWDLVRSASDCESRSTAQSNARDSSKMTTTEKNTAPAAATLFQLMPLRPDFCPSLAGVDGLWPNRAEATPAMVPPDATTRWTHPAQSLGNKGPGQSHWGSHRTRDA